MVVVDPIEEEQKVLFEAWLLGYQSSEMLKEKFRKAHIWLVRRGYMKIEALTTQRLNAFFMRRDNYVIEMYGSNLYIDYYENIKEAPNTRGNRELLVIPANLLQDDFRDTVRDYPQIQTLNRPMLLEALELDG
jgi:hypothetical protein